MSVTNDDVRHMASLARLVIDDEHVSGVVDQLNGILLHIDELKDAPLPDRAPTTTVAGMMLRDDGARSVALQRTREQLAPQARDGFFLVPRLATHEDAGARSGEGDA